MENVTNDVAPTPNPQKRKLSISLDYRIVIFVLLAVIAGMFIIWKPWNSQPKATDRTIDVTGDATIQADPDEFVFNPSYNFTNADKTAALAAMSAKSDAIVTKLKALGVADNKIKSNANGGNDQYYYYPMPVTTDGTYTLQMTITVGTKELAQKVQDYLLTTTPTGSVTPQAGFSDTTQKKLESQARDKATKDARAKADQSAKNLGFKVGAVKTVSDGSGFGGCYNGLCSGANLSTDASEGKAAPSLTVQPGQNDLIYSVSVTYYVK